MESYDSSHFSPFQTLEEPSIPLEIIRFIPVLFGVPEGTFAYLAVHAFQWAPSKFAGDYGDLTLKEIEKLFEGQIVRRGYSTSLVSHLFQPLRNILRKPPARDRSSKDERPLGAYRLREFFTICGEEDIRNWCRSAKARLEPMRQKAAIADRRFELVWLASHGELVRKLPRYIHGHHTTPEDIAQSTWLAIQIGHDTGAEWDFNGLLRIAKDIYWREPSGRGLELIFLDEIAVDDARDDRTPPWHIPAYVKIALLNTLFDGVCLPHEVITFLSRLLLKLPPRTIVESYSSRTLFDLICEIFAAYLPRTTVPEALVRELFARFDSRLGSTFDQVTRHGRRLNAHPRLLRRVVGWTRLKDYFKSRSARARATEAGHWWGNVLEHLKDQATTPDTPLFLALHRWRNDDSDCDDEPE